MSFRERLADLIRGPKIANSTPLPQITRNSSTWGDYVSTISKIPALSEQTALTISAIYACVNLISGAIAALPVNIYAKNITDGDRTRLFDHKLNWVFNEQFTARWSAANAWEFLVMSLLLQGDAFALIIRNPSAEPIGLEPIHPRRMTVALNPFGDRLVYVVEAENGNGKTLENGYKVYDQDDVLHVAGFGFDGFRGLSPLRYALRLVGGVSFAMQDFSANFFANSARPDYALTTDQALGTAAVEQIRAEIDEKHKGTQNSHRPMLLHSGLDLKTITMPLQDMQLLESRKFQLEEICRIYGVPPFMIGHNEKTTSWGTGIAEMGAGFNRYALRQHTIKFENEINRKLFRVATRVAEFDTTDLERADTKTFYEGLRIAVGRAGEPQLLTVNEARAEMRRNKKDGMDTLVTNGATSNATQQTS